MYGWGEQVNALVKGEVRITGGPKVRLLDYSTPTEAEFLVGGHLPHSAGKSLGLNQPDSVNQRGTKTSGLNPADRSAEYSNGGDGGERPSF